MSNPLSILSTRNLTPESISALESTGIDLIQHNFIEKRIDIPKDLERGSIHKNIIFTSKMGVLAFKEMSSKMEIDPNSFIFHSLSHGTLKLANELGLQIKNSAGDAASLADKICEDKEIRSVTHICGNLRRNELREKLNNSGIEVQEIIAYSTISTPVIIDQNYDAIFFFSPSAVDSFLSLNGLRSVPCFCIGKTTSKYAAGKGYQEIFAPESPSEEALIECIFDHYLKNDNA